MKTETVVGLQRVAESDEENRDLAVEEVSEGSDTAADTGSRRCGGGGRRVIVPLTRKERPSRSLFLFLSGSALPAHCHSCSTFWRRELGWSALPTGSAR